MSNKPTEQMMLWRLYQLMAERNIRTSVELQRKLEKVGVHVSSQNLLRLIKQNPKRVSSDIMYGLTEVLQCSAADLWVNPNQAGEFPPVPTPSKQKAKAPRTIKRDERDDFNEMVGPKITPFPSPYED